MRDDDVSRGAGRWGGGCAGARGRRGPREGAGGACWRLMARRRAAGLAQRVRASGPDADGRMGVVDKGVGARADAEIQGGAGGGGRAAWRCTARRAGICRAQRPRRPACRLGWLGWATVVFAAIISWKAQEIDDDDDDGDDDDNNENG